MVDKLTTIANVKLFLRIDTGADDDLLDVLVAQASQMIETYIGRKLKSQVYTSEEYDGNGFTDLYLDNFPITAVASIHNWDSYNDVSFYEYTVKEEYLIYDKEGYIYLRSGWSRGRKNFQITYTAGYDPIPADVVISANKLVAYLYNNPDKSGIKAERIGAYSITLANVENLIPEDIRLVLDNYRIKQI